MNPETFFAEVNFSREPFFGYNLPFGQAAVTSVSYVSMHSHSSAESSSVSSDREDLSISSGPEDDLVEVNPRKKRRLSPPDEKSKVSISRISDSTVSRIKSRKEVHHATRRPKSVTVETATPSLERDNFENINVQPWLVASLSNMAITRPTGIQKACIPEILKGRDCIGGSRTGSGKTMAFAVPILQKWAEDPVGIFALILTPTRCVMPL